LLGTGDGIELKVLYLLEFGLELRERLMGDGVVATGSKRL
jgi:hypothetical protein